VEEERGMEKASREMTRLRITWKIMRRRRRRRRRRRLR
jgi:hypothetical protein